MIPQQQIDNFQSSHPNQNYAFHFSWQALRDIKNKSADINGIRFYEGYDENNKFQLHAVGTIDGKDYQDPGTLNTKTYSGGLPCPTYCT